MGDIEAEQQLRRERRRTQSLPLTWFDALTDPPWPTLDSLDNNWPRVNFAAIEWKTLQHVQCGRTYHNFHHAYGNCPICDYFNEISNRVISDAGAKNSLKSEEPKPDCLPKKHHATKARKWQRKNYKRIRKQRRRQR